MHTPSTALPSASTDPTDRSIPAMTSTYVMPTEAISSGGIWWVIIRNVPNERNRSESRPNTATRSTRTVTMAR